jgi:hypothetical protein
VPRGRRASRTVATFAVTAALAASWIAPQSASSQIDVLPTLSQERFLEIVGLDSIPADLGLLAHVDFPAESPLILDGLPIYSFTAALTPDGDVQMREMAATAETTSGAGVDECSDPAFAPSSALWAEEDMPIEWRFAKGTTPKGTSKFYAKRAIRQAHRVWPQSHSNCSGADRLSFRFDYLGGSSRTVDYDGVNVVEFGFLDSGALAVNYTWFKGDRILEVDMRLNKSDYEWSGRDGAEKRYNIANVVAHELGHQIGLEDLSDPHGSLTMFARINRGETSKTTLGRGDLKGASLVAP